MPYKNLTLEEWEQKIDAWLMAHLGLGKDDLTDQNWSSMWEDGWTPAQAAKQALACESGDDEVFD